MESPKKGGIVKDVSHLSHRPNGERGQAGCEKYSRCSSSPTPSSLLLRLLFCLDPWIRVRCRPALSYEAVQGVRYKLLKRFVVRVSVGAAGVFIAGRRATGRGQRGEEAATSLLVQNATCPS